MPSIRVEGIGMRFYFNRHRRVVTPNAARWRRGGTVHWGLRDVSIVADAGQGIALIGASGSGKTTLLRVLAGVYAPDVGRAVIRGRVASLLSIDAGLLALLTGRENALLLGVLGGLSRQQSNRLLGAVKERSKLGDAFEDPVSTYSQGMRARLGFAVAEELEPRILLLDEVHEALDHEFRAIVQARAEGIIATGGIVVATGHDHSMLERLCERAIYLQRGILRADGAFKDVQRAYLDDVTAGMEAS
jgi:ABC-type polysaccharide/polyol phosphate transport system ATPase subunit